MMEQILIWIKEAAKRYQLTELEAAIHQRLNEIARVEAVETEANRRPMVMDIHQRLQERRQLLQQAAQQETERMSYVPVKPDRNDAIEQIEATKTRLRNER